ncbi:MAG TPA: SpoIIE family protein phosphatase [Bacillus bacterium]|nr:SpoIIE family protein phosphatase [Bacillus sp. (in: firmicutes)]
MSNTDTLDKLSTKFYEATVRAFELLNQSIKVRTFFVGRTTEDSYTTLKVFSKIDGCQLTEGRTIPLQESYCNLIFSGKREPLMIEDTSVHPIVSKLAATSRANIGSYLGVPIILEDHTMFGTLCAVDPSAHKFTNDDIEVMQTLANFISNAIELGAAFERILIEEQRVKKELNFAKIVQTSVLSEPVDLENINISAYYQSSDSLSGDMYSWFEIAPNKYGIMLLDVMGHGVSAALISMSIRAVLRGFITNISDPVEVMKELNHHIYYLFNSNDQSTYATAIYIVVDTNLKTIEYANAGHPSGLLLLDGEAITRMEEGCLILGIFPEIQVNKQQFIYKDPSTVLLYTDGIIELITPVVNEGIKELENILTANPNNGGLIEEIQRKYVNGKALKDDVCLISINVK